MKKKEVIKNLDDLRHRLQVIANDPEETIYLPEEDVPELLEAVTKAIDVLRGMKF